MVITKPQRKRSNVLQTTLISHIHVVTVTKHKEKIAFVVNHSDGYVYLVTSATGGGIVIKDGTRHLLKVF